VLGLYAIFASSCKLITYVAKWGRERQQKLDEHRASGAMRFEQLLRRFDDEATFGAWTQDKSPPHEHAHE